MDGSDEIKLLSHSEVEAVMRALKTSRGKKGFDKGEFEKVVEWANITRFNYQMLELAFQELVNIEVHNEEVQVIPNGYCYDNGIEHKLN